MKEQPCSTSSESKYKSDPLGRSGSHATGVTAGQIQMWRKLSRAVNQPRSQDRKWVIETTGPATAYHKAESSEWSMGRIG
jgi:hypothetical protein